MAKRKSAMDRLVERHKTPWRADDRQAIFLDDNGRTIQFDPEEKMAVVAIAVAAVNAAYPVKKGKTRGKT